LVPLSDVSFAEAAGRVRAVAVPMDHDGDTTENRAGEDAGNGSGSKASRRKVAAAR
jgi:hypothetical protein